jgi:hypothetical protein
MEGSGSGAGSDSEQIIADPDGPKTDSANLSLKIYAV